VHHKKGRPSIATSHESQGSEHGLQISHGSERGLQISPPPVQAAGYLGELLFLWLSRRCLARRGVSADCKFRENSPATSHESATQHCDFSRIELCQEPNTSSRAIGTAAHQGSPQPEQGGDTEQVTGSTRHTTATPRGVTPAAPTLENQPSRLDTTHELEGQLSNTSSGTSGFMKFASTVTSKTSIRKEPDTRSQGAEHKCLQEQVI